MDFEIDDSDTKTRGLGRGLNALFADDDGIADEVIEKIEENVKAQEETGKKQRFLVGVEQIYPSAYQPRRIFNQDRIEELASSIKEYGILQPLLVRGVPGEEGKYDLIAGERRWRAAQIAQIHEVPVIVLDLDDLAAYKIALIENLQREDLDPIDEAMGYKRLLDDYGQTQESLAKAVGKSRPHVTNMLRLLNLPDAVQAHVSAGDLTMGHARALITAEDPEGLAKEVIAQGLSVRETEKLAADSSGREQKQRPKAGKTSAARSGASRDGQASIGASRVEKDADTLALENDMSNALGMRVSIDTTDGHSGKLSVEFKSLDQLDEVLHRLAHFPGRRLNG